MNYLARCSYLLQQGHFYADVAYFYGEEGPLTAVFGWKAAQDLPDGYAFDFVNSDVILNQLTFTDGRLVTPGGTSYRILYLGGRSQRMTLPVLEQLSSLVRQGAVIVGNKPVDSPSLADDENEFHRVADALWGTGVAGKSRGKEAAAPALCTSSARDECTSACRRTMCLRLLGHTAGLRVHKAGG